MKIALVTRIERDIVLSIRSASLRTLLPLVLYAALYPWLLTSMGSEVLGLWSLFASAPALAGLLDFGIPQLLSRRAATGDNCVVAHRTLTDARLAEIFYLSLIFLLSSIATVVIVLFFPDLTVRPYRSIEIVASLWIMAFGIGAYLSARIHGSLLASIHKNYDVHLGFALQPTLTAICTAIGLLFQRPIEGFAIGLLLSSLALRAWFHRKLRADVILSGLPEQCGKGRLSTLLLDGKGLYAANAALTARDPVLRLVITASGGLAAVATYEIASRLTRLARDLASAPFSGLLPSFSALWASAQREHILRISLISVATMVVVGGGLLILISSGLAVAGNQWLQVPPPELLFAVLLISAWNFITLFNAPYWLLLLATGQEKLALRAIIVHTLLLIAACPALITYQASLSTTLVFWLASSLMTQHLIFSAASRTLEVPYWSLFGSRLLLPILVLVVFALIATMATIGFREHPFIGLGVLCSIGLIYFFVQHFVLLRKGLHPMNLNSLPRF